MEHQFLQVDLGQLVISGFIAVFGYLMKSEISDFKRRLNDHDQKLIGLVSDVQRLIGRTEMMRWNGTDRHKSQDE